MGVKVKRAVVGLGNLSIGETEEKVLRFLAGTYGTRANGIRMVLIEYYKSHRKEIDPKPVKLESPQSFYRNNFPGMSYTADCRAYARVDADPKNPNAYGHGHMEYLKVWQRYHSAICGRIVPLPAEENDPKPEDF